MLQHSDSSSAVNSPTLLCLIDINSLFGHERACLSLNAASHTESDGIRFSGNLYLLFKLPGRRCVQRETILLDWQCGEQTPRTNFHTRFDCSLGDLFRNYWFCFFTSFAISSEFLFLNICMMFLLIYFDQFDGDFVLVFDFFDHCKSLQSGVFGFFLSSFSWIMYGQTTIFKGSVRSFLCHCIRNPLKLIFFNYIWSWVLEVLDNLICREQFVWDMWISVNNRRQCSPCFMRKSFGGIR